MLPVPRRCPLGFLLILAGIPAHVAINSANRNVIRET
jgi:hypothetical protein